LGLWIEHRAHRHPALPARKRNTDTDGITDPTTDADRNSHGRANRHSRAFDDPGAVWYADAYAHAFADANSHPDAFADANSHPDAFADRDCHASPGG
jgi:hypothetical protein